MGDGDPSVCDGFYYPALGPDAPEIAMGDHFDPGWWTVKQGCSTGGLQVWDCQAEVWIDVESEEFYGSLDPGSCVVVFVGERTGTWTEGSDLEVPAVRHRVAAPTGSNPRKSFIFELRD